MPIGPLARRYFEESSQKRDYSGAVRDIRDIGAVYRCLKSLEGRGLVERVDRTGLRTLWRAMPGADEAITTPISLLRHRSREGWTPEKIAAHYRFDALDVFRVLLGRRKRPRTGRPP